jgi:HEAT repeat protein
MRTSSPKLVIIIVLVSLSMLHPNRGFAQEDKPIVEQWRDVLRYGIESEVLKVIKSISDAGETSLNEELLSLFEQSLSMDVRKAVLEFFSAKKIRDAESFSLSLLSDEQLYDSRLKVSLIHYLSAIESPGLETRLLTLIDHQDDQVAEAAITALGAVGSPEAGGMLIERLQDVEYPDSQKPEIILALGKMKSEAAVQPLISIVSNRDEQRIWRLYAASSLGEIGDEQAIPHLKNMFGEQDSLVKIYAASALSKFDMGEVEDLLRQGLRDSNVKVRLASAQALANKQARSSVDILIYKAENDPERAVRLQAIESLAVIGTRAAFDYLRKVYGNRGKLPVYREAAFVALCDNELTANLEMFRRIVEQEWDKGDRKVIEFTAKKLSETEAPGLKWFYERFLGSPEVNVRIYALRGIQKNRVRTLKDRVEVLAKEDPYAAVRSLALSVLEQL